MSSIKRLIHEIHRRSLWQVLGVYLVGAWLAYQVIGTLWETLHLPQWVPGVAIVLFIIGLPIVLATAFVQEGIGSGREPAAEPAAPTEPEAAQSARSAQHKLFTWRNALAGGMIAFAGLGVVTAGTVVVRSFGAGATDAEAIDANAVAVLPFRVSGSPDLAYLREGMVDLLAAKLTGEGGPRAVDQRTVLRAWRGAVSANTDDLPQDAALDLARSLRAGMLLLGDVVGTPAHVTLNASLHSTQSNEPPTRASVSGPMDSIPTMIDRLAAEMLSRRAGENLERLATLTTASLPALQAFLAGQAAYRSGHFTAAAADFRRAVDMDTMFALAGFMLAQAKGWDGYGPDWQRGRQIAWQGRDRLSPRDREIVTAVMGEHFPDPTPQHLQLAAWQRLMQREADLPEIWYGLGDQYFHNGILLGFDDAHERAASAFQRALEIDSTYAPPLRHMVDIALYRGDTSSVRRLSERYFNLAPEARESSFGLQVARRLGDDAWATRVLAAVESFTPQDAANILLGARLGVVPPEDAVRIDELVRRNADSPDWQSRLWSVSDFYADAGQPGRSLEVVKQIGRVQSERIGVAFATVDHALLHDGDEASAAQAVTELPTLASVPRDRYGAVLMLAMWRTHTGDLKSARETLRRAYSMLPPDTAPAADRFFSNLFLRITETRLATAELAPDLRAQATRLDSLLTKGIISAYPTALGNLVVADAFAAAGDLERALAAARRRGTVLRPALLLAEARIATRLNDRDAAIRAYQEFLALRPHPEPGRPTQTVEAARRELATLLRPQT